MNRITRIVLLLVILAAASSPCLAQASKSPEEPPAPAVEYSAKAWKEFSSAGGGFSILMPDTPTERIEAQTGRVEMHDFTIQTPALFCGLTYFDFPSDLEGSQGLKQIMERARDNMVTSSAGTLLEDKEITFDGHPARFYRIKMGGGTTFLARLIAVGRRLYQLGFALRDAGTSPATDKLRDELEAKYLDSFKLVPNAADTNHTVIREGAIAPTTGSEAAPAPTTEGEVDRLLKDKSAGILVMGSGDNPQPTSAPRRVVTGGVLAGRALYKPEPQYPPVAKAARVQGTVTVEIVVDEEGKVMAAQAESGHPLLQAAAVKAAREWRFSPTLLDGKPVKVLGLVTITFALK